MLKNYTMSLLNATTYFSITGKLILRRSFSCGDRMLHHLFLMFHKVVFTKVLQRLLFHPEQPSCLRQHQAGQKTLEKKKSKLGLLCLLNVPKKYQIMRKWDKVLSVLPTLSYTYKIVLSVKCLILVWHDKICLSKPCFLLRISWISFCYLSFTHTHP